MNTIDSLWIELPNGDLVNLTYFRRIRQVVGWDQGMDPKVDEPTYFMIAGTYRDVVLTQGLNHDAELILGSYGTIGEADAQYARLKQMLARPSFVQRPSGVVN